MAVFRVERNTGYTVMSNHHLRNKELSLKAKGLLSQMLSLPEDWDYTLSGLSYINRESIDAIRTAVWELEKAGYIPFATMTNREWGQIGNNYLKALFALGFQGFLIMICVGIYAVLVGSMIVADNLHSAIFSLAAYTVILCFSLFKTGALAKSIFNAH